MGHDDADPDTGGTATGTNGLRGPEAPESTRVIVGDVTLVHGSGDAVELAVPDRIGRYRVLGVLGKGGMGIVYEAHDPVLDRPVAIKLVRAGLQLRSIQARQRLMREAQTIAQMSHPNIVAVYEVGNHDEQLFIAMELVEGKSLRRWLDAAPRTRAEILAVLEQAGLGLAAAHRVGIVHRDFKPDNVMITPQGVPGDYRVRVLDFGLARIGEAGSSDAGDGAPASLLGDDRLTMTGFAMGTPAYMAPEQFVGTNVDAHSDQFAFCVVAIEALGGRRPFSGNTLDELARQTHRGELDATALRGLPAGMAAVLRRGLAAEPTRRWPDMTTLLEALHGRRRRRRRALAIGAALCVAAGLALAEARAPACPREAELREGVWDEPGRARLHAVFVAIGTRTAASTWEAVRDELDRRVDAWIGATATGCNSCLLRQGAEIATTIAALETIDRTTLHNTGRVLATLPDPSACAHDTAPITPALADAQAHLSSAQALAALGDGARARPELDLADAVEQLDDSPAANGLLAEIERLRGRLAAREGDELEATRSFERSYFAALRSERDALAVLAAAELAAAGAVGYRERWQWAQHARAALARTDEREAAAAYDRGMCTLQRDSGALDEAALHCARALAASSDASETEERIAALKALADVHTIADRLGEARDLYAEALALAEQSFGAEHPAIADALDDLAHAELRLHANARARELAERALTLREKSGTPDDPTLARSWHVIASIELDEGRDRAAFDGFARALALRRRTLGEQHREVAISWYELALAQERLGRLDDALQSMATCAAIEQQLHPLDIARIPTLRELARMAYTFGAGPSAGLEHLERAWVIVQDSGVPLDHPLVKDLDHGYGETLLALGRANEALPYLERFVADPRPSDIGPHVSFVLARALWKSSSDVSVRQRAIELVERAAADAERARGETDLVWLEAMRTWLAEPARRDEWREGMNWR